MTTMNAQVLVLNKNWQPIATTGVERAFGLLFSGAAKALDDQYQAFDYKSWAELGADLGGEHDIIHTAKMVLRVPRVLVLQVYDKFPHKQVRFSRANVYARDDFTCQYCGTKFARSKLNLDHVVPRCQGGRTTWENVVCSCIECNLAKGGRTPAEAKMKLVKQPRRPSISDFSARPGKVWYKEWRPFLSPVDASYWHTELQDDD